MKIPVFVTCHLIPYPELKMRSPSFFVDIPDPVDFTRGQALLAEVRRKVSWLRNYLCCYYRDFKNGAGWTTLGADSLVCPVGQLCLQAVTGTRNAYRIGLIYIGTDVSWDSIPTAIVPLSSAQKDAALRGELKRRVPNAQHYRWEFYCRSENEQGLSPIEKSPVNKNAVYIKATPQQPPCLPDQPVSKHVAEGMPCKGDQKLREVNLRRHWQRGDMEGPLVRPLLSAT